MNQNLTPISALVGIALAGSLGLAQAEGNPFAAQDMNGGYMQLAEADSEGKCGEGKCGGSGGDKDDGKGDEGKCGGADDKKGDGKDGEGKCGEGKCGGGN
ncbi:putative low-complexity protein [Thiorhodovibrio winogradskyi]|uniref:Low-complexity protein n=1 Tax=Thiorhodovibrio winogradskyi TaxID=77007 RepID=A0ABZ0SC26_9GAMM|nr:low-complexity protein [Thiorhodovibrio winogradskyi]